MALEQRGRPAGQPRSLSPGAPQLLGILEAGELAGEHLHAARHVFATMVAAGSSL